MIVAPARVPRDVSARGIGEGDALVRFPRRVIHAATDDPQRSLEERRRTRTERSMPRHIIHLAVPAPFQPSGESRLGGSKVGIRDADRLEAEFRSPLPDSRGE